MIDIGNGREYWIRASAVIGIKHETLRGVTVYLRGMRNYVAMFDDDAGAVKYVHQVRDEVLR